jgi:DNA invertase Pin-like site-specific DNA recombinase
MAEVRVINPIASPETNKLRVCAYARVSSDSDDQQNSFVAQVDYYTELINSNEDWEFVDIYADEGLTGTRADKREDFQRMLKDCRKGKIDRILTKSISRFARNTRDCLETIRELKTLGVEVEFEKEQINTGKITSEMMVSFFGSFAQEESISISNNMRWSYRKRMQSGEFITCKAPYGYRLVNGDLIVHEQEARVVRRIFQSYIAGKGMLEIADELSAEKIPKRNGGTDWLESTVAYILKNERYMGDALLQKKCSTDTLPFRKIRNHGEKDKYYVQNSHTPIISKAEFEQARKITQRQSAYDKANKPRQYPLSRKIVCGECGGTFKRRVCNGKTYWVCRNHDRGKEKCGVKQIQETEIYEAFKRMYHKLRHNSRYILFPLLEQLQALKAAGTMSNVRIGEINKEIAELTGRNLILARLKSKGYMDSAVFMEQTNEINQKIISLRAKRRNLLEKDEDDSAITDVKNLIAIIEDGRPVQQGFDEPLFHGVVDKIVAVSQEEIRFRLIGGLELTERLRRSVR